MRVFTFCTVLVMPHMLSCAEPGAGGIRLTIEAKSVGTDGDLTFVDTALLFEGSPSPVGAWRLELGTLARPSAWGLTPLGGTPPTLA